jgi:uncharacterized phiE125 gp8 family phage protein
MDTIVIVTSPASSRDLTRLDTVKDELDIADDESDAKLTRWIREASGAIESYVGRVLAEETVVQTFRLEHRLHEARKHEPLALQRYPVTAIAAVVDPFGTTLVQDTDYELDPTTGLLWRLGGARRIRWVPGKTVVTYTAGYALLDGLPFPIEQACLTLLKHRWAAKTRDPMVKSEETVGVERMDYWVGQVGDNGALPPEVTGLLDPFREVRV